MGTRGSHNSIGQVQVTHYLSDPQAPVVGDHCLGVDCVEMAPDAQEAPGAGRFDVDRADQVHFMELNAPSARLIQLLEQGGDTSAETLLQTLAAELGQDVHTLRPFLADILKQWQLKDILLGIRS